jgi:uncharacterized protein (DUF2336 family)
VCPAKPERFDEAMGAPLALIHELDSKIEGSSADRRALMLRQLTDLFLVGVEHYSADEIALIDDIFVRLVASIEESARALLAIRLGPVAKTPPKVLRLLACDDAIDVASTVLTQSEGLDDPTLIACATTKSQEHMLAISQRKALSAPVTDVLVERGDRHVVLSVAMNAGARFSIVGFGTLVERARGDDALATSVGARVDLPRPLFETLLAAASEVVRARLSAVHHRAADVERAIRDAAARIRADAATLAPVHIEAPNRAGKSTSTTLVDLARAGRMRDLATALALMGHIPGAVAEEMLNDPQAEGLLILAKTIGLSWDTTRAILESGGEECRRSTGDLDKLRVSFQRLKQHTAQQILAFHRARTRGETVN